jgi:Spy/CpxP family protein refolding chaperone
MPRLGQLVLASLLTFTAMPAPSAGEPSIDQQIQMVRSLAEAQREATIALNVELTSAESDKFWPIYRDYRNDVAKQDRVADQRQGEVADQGLARQPEGA